METTTPRDPLGIVSLVCGIAALLSVPFGLIPLLGCLAIPVGLLGSLAGVVLGITALVRSRERDLAAIAGLVLGLSWVLLAIAAIVLLRHDGGRQLTELFEASNKMHGP